ncbi:hypothetical protein ACROYT_G025041 [Oculina patagonica]
MSSIVKAVFEATVGLLVNKGRDWAAKKLKEGDLTDEKFRSLIVREIDDIKSKLDGISRKDLLASISFFKEGIVTLYDVFENSSHEENSTALTKGDNVEVNLQSTAAGSVKTVSLTKELSGLRLTVLEESAREALLDAKERFKDARRKATEAFGNEALNKSDRILAMTLRVMGTILEKINNPANALAACRVCLEELHTLPSVQKCFTAEIAEETKGFKSWLKSWFKSDEQKEIVAIVCHINHAIYDVMQMVDLSNKGLLIWPCVDIGTEKLDPLRDARVTQFTQYMGHFPYMPFPVPWSFGQEGEEEHKLKSASRMCSNKKEQFIVGCRSSNKVQVFDCNGKFLNCFSCSDEDENEDFHIEDVAADQDDNVYLLVTVQNEFKQAHWCRAVYVFDKDNNFQYLFNLGDRFRAVSLTTEESSKNIFVLGYYWRPELRNRRSVSVVEVYKTNGSFVDSFGEDILNPGFLNSITADNNGHVMILVNFCVHVFTVDGDHLYQFAVGSERSQSIRRFNHNLDSANEHVVYVLRIFEPKSEFVVFIYTKYGELVYSIRLDSPQTYLSGMTVTTKGRIAILVNHDCGNNDDSVRKGEILVL